MSNDKNKKILEISSMLSSLRAEKHEKSDSLTVREEAEITAKVKELMAAQSAYIVEGATPCKKCEKAPHGMVQYTAVKSKPMPYFEVGCLDCVDKRSQGFSIDEAVENWNSEKFLK